MPASLIYAVSKRSCGAALVVFFALAGCSRKTRAHIPASPVPARIGASETGIASWYGDPYHGRRAASGETYDMEQFTAAHRTLPFDTWVEVTDLENGKRVDVRINDRGPFIKGRIIDLSLAAARSIDMIGPGTARVRLKVIAAPVNGTGTGEGDPLPADPVTGLYAVQIGAFTDPARARALAASFLDLYKDTVVVEGESERGKVWRVLISRNLSVDDATRLATNARQARVDAVVVTNR